MVYEHTHTQTENNTHSKVKETGDRSKETGEDTQAPASASVHSTLQLIPPGQPMRPQSALRAEQWRSPVQGGGLTT